MTEPEAVTRAREWVQGAPFMRYTAADLLPILLAAYDTLAASVRDREAAAWVRGCEDLANCTKAWPRNPYREGNTDD